MAFLNPTLFAALPSRFGLGFFGFNRARLQGYSLIELMVALGIAAILASVALPSFSEMLKNNRLVSAASALQVSLSLARSEAIKRGSNSTVTVAANSRAGDWSKGWTVFVDKTNNAHAGLAPTSDNSSNTGWTRLAVTAALAGSIQSSQTAAPNYFSFNGLGRVVDVNGDSGQRSFWFFDGNSQRFCLTLGNTGRVRSERVAASADCPVN